MERLQRMTKGAGDTDMGATATQKKGGVGSKVQAPVAKVRTLMVIVIVIDNAVATEIGIGIGILIRTMGIVMMVMVIVLQIH